MAKTKQRGYYKLKTANKWGHFSMNCWINLKQDSGRDIGTLAADYDNQDETGQFLYLADIMYAALKAYDQEEDNEIDYNVFKVRNWMSTLKEEDSKEFMDAMMHSINTPGKKVAKK